MDPSIWPPIGLGVTIAGLIFKAGYELGVLKTKVEKDKEQLRNYDMQCPYGDYLDEIVERVLDKYDARQHEQFKRLGRGKSRD
jgi:hypothetical protein